MLRVHDGKKFKFSQGIYADHPDAVAEMVEGPHAKALAYLHDTVEHMLDVLRGPHKWDPAREEACVAFILQQFGLFFINLGFDKALIAAHMQDLDVLTKRRHQSYQQYIVRLTRYAVRAKRKDVLAVKRADLKHNSLRERNPPPHKQARRVRLKLALYAWADRQIDRAMAWIQAGKEAGFRCHVPALRKTGLAGRARWARDYAQGGSSPHFTLQT